MASTARIDTVYRTVQDLVNKEQRGHLTPQEFNHLANLAQTEIFEAYFHDLNFYENAAKVGKTNSEYADLPMHFRERINLLSTTGTDLVYTDGLFTLPDSLYRLTSVTRNGVYIQQEEYTSWAELSPLAQANESRPTYLRKGNTIQVNPGTITDNVDVNYIRRPNTPKWGYITVNDSPLYAGARSTEFEIHRADESELIIKILGYAGVVIREAELVKAAQAADKYDTDVEKYLG